MNKITKIWALLVALCALVVSLAANAQDVDTWDTKTVTLVLQDGQNSCTIHDYNLGTQSVSSVDQPVQWDTTGFRCDFMKTPAYQLVISLTDLTAGGGTIGTIPSEQFTWVFSNITKEWTISTNLTPTDITFNTTGQHIYDKLVNTIWVLTWDLAIWWVVPGWTPAGTYTWELNLTIQVGNS